MGTRTDASDRVIMLGAVPLLSGLARSQLERIAAVGDEKGFPSGEAIVREGEKGFGLYLLLSGSADVCRSGRKASSQSVGDFLGEAALLVEEPRTADVRATTDVRCLVLNRWDFWGGDGRGPQGRSGALRGDGPATQV